MYEELEFEKFVKKLKPKAIYNFSEIVKSRTYEYENQMTELEKLKGNNMLLIYAIRKNNEIKDFKIVVQ